GRARLHKPSGIQVHWLFPKAKPPNERETSRTMSNVLKKKRKRRGKLRRKRRHRIRKNAHSK
ncbi:MAG: hypothetical protein V3T83_06525, partial [Acidobacteriota bacterium]